MIVKYYHEALMAFLAACMTGYARKDARGVRRDGGWLFHE